jgi:copper chaperone CopZ
VAGVTVRTHIRIVGMSCRKCVAGLEGALAALPGVHRATVNFEHGDAEIEHDAALQRERMLETVEAAGYDAV